MGGREREGVGAGKEREREERGEKRRRLIMFLSTGLLMNSKIALVKYIIYCGYIHTQHIHLFLLENILKLFLICEVNTKSYALIRVLTFTLLKSKQIETVLKIP